MTAERSKIILGSRGSELARAQAHLVGEAIQAVRPELRIETKIITTKGDETRIVDLHAGRKGLFTAEIERALLAREVDVAVHSAKDLPSETNPGAEIAAVLPRAPLGDVLVSKHPEGLGALPRGAIVATGGVRRKHQLLWKRVDLPLVDLHGNVPTRLRKLAENEWDAVVLARAGLERLGMSLSRAEISFEGRRFFLEILPDEIFLPAGGQGIIAVQVRTDDQSAKAVVAPINHRETLLCLRAEREFLRRLQGDCDCPVGVVANIDNGKMKMRVQLFMGSAMDPREAAIEGSPADPERLAAELLSRLGAPAFAQGYGPPHEHQ